jgi:hypothetical protein
MDRRADVTEHRGRPARQDRRQPAPLARQHRPADGVDAPVHPAQTGRPVPAASRPSARRPGAAMAPATPPPLPPRQLGQRHIGGYAT